jgi:hypothetical protein
MSDLIVAPAPVSRTPALVALGADAPTIEELFAFMAEAELRVSSLRMRVEVHTANARGMELETHDLVLRHPGRARITTRRGEAALGRDYEVWSSDGEVVTRFDAAAARASVRPLPPALVGASDERLPAFARVRPPLTALPSESVLDTMVHPRGFIRNVLMTGPLALLGGTHLANRRETLVLRADHPRSTHVLTDRPDRWIEVGADRMTGFITLLVEHVGARVTRHVEAVAIELDPAVPDEAFTVHLPSDVRMIF